jgi:isopenicillin N synthase-like dioxygenase
MATGGSVAGLEVATPEGGYEPIPPGHGHVLIMAGRMLELLTNGYVRGLKHRATWYRDVRGERFAMPYFVGPRVDFQLRPLPRFVERAGEERYESYGVFDFIRAVTAFGDANYSDHEKKDAIVGSSVISDPVSIDFARKRRAPARPQSGA